MDTDAYVSFTNASIPALVSTVITVCYFIIRLLNYILNASSRETKDRKIETSTGIPEQEHGSMQGAEGSVEVYPTVLESLHMTTLDGQEQHQQYPTGTLLLPKRGTNIHLPTLRNDTEDTTVSPLCPDTKGLWSRRHTTTDRYTGTGPKNACYNATGIFTEGRSRSNASHAQSQLNERNGRESYTAWWPVKIHDVGISQFRPAAEARYTGAPELEVTDISVQTDTCNTIYVTKDTLVAYTIAVVQNTQSLKFEQMQVALQTVHNQASIEMPLTAEKLMIAHFYLALLTDNIPRTPPSNAQESEVAAADAHPSTSTSDQETTHKTPYKCKGDSHTSKQRTQPTKAVSPTRQDEYGLVCGIPAGYESDNSWDGTSTLGKQDCAQNNDISSFVAFRRWPNRPNGGRGQSYGQINNIVVWGRNAPYSRV